MRNRKFYPIIKAITCTVCDRQIGSETIVWNGQGRGFRHERCKR